ncbi:MAG: hypothetical protein AAF530_01535 [Pseudomonadota bacterium]
MLATLHAPSMAMLATAILARVAERKLAEESNLERLDFIENLPI